MCGRADDDFGPAGWETLTRLFGDLGWTAGRTDVRPTDPLRFIRPCGDGFEGDTGRWGLIPDGLGLKEARRYATFNARVETLAERPVFRGAFHARRCVIPLAGFYEWPVVDGVKTKVRIARKDGRPLLVAGLWNCAGTPDGPLTSCTVVTRPPTPDLVAVHDRMPALLLTRDLPGWLTGSPEAARRIAATGWPSGVLTVTPSG